MEKCSDCHAGAITNTGPSPGASACTACASGKYSTASNVATCSDCFPGKYSGTGAKACIDCPIGKQHLYWGATSVNNCSAWARCVPGEFISKRATYWESRVCDKCRPGRYSPVFNAESCTQCSLGLFHNVTGASTLSNCSRWTVCNPRSFVYLDTYEVARGYVKYDGSALACGLDGIVCLRRGYTLSSNTAHHSSILGATCAPCANNVQSGTNQCRGGVPGKIANLKVDAVGTQFLSLSWSPPKSVINASTPTYRLSLNDGDRV